MVEFVKVLRQRLQLKTDSLPTASLPTAYKCLDKDSVRSLRLVGLEITTNSPEKKSLVNFIIIPHGLQVLKDKTFTTHGLTRIYFQLLSWLHFESLRQRL